MTSPCPCSSSLALLWPPHALEAALNQLSLSHASLTQPHKIYPCQPPPLVRSPSLSWSSTLTSSLALLSPPRSPPDLPAGYTQTARISQDDAPSRRTTEEGSSMAVYQEHTSEDSEDPSSGEGAGEDGSVLGQLTLPSLMLAPCILPPSHPS